MNYRSQQCTGVLGAFNCQGGGWSRETRRNKNASDCSHTVSCMANPSTDIEWKAGRSPISIKDVDLFAVYMYKEKKLKLVKPSESLEITLDPFQFELLTVSPVKVLPRNNNKTNPVQVAPLGLVNMLNGGGAVEWVELHKDSNRVAVGVKGCGEMKAFASEEPGACKINGERVKFRYEGCMIGVDLPFLASSQLSIVEYLF